MYGELRAKSIHIFDRGMMMQRDIILSAFPASPAVNLLQGRNEKILSELIYRKGREDRKDDFLGGLGALRGFNNSALIIVFPQPSTLRSLLRHML
jgi:hypothetical protein